MTVKTGQAWAGLFVTLDATGALAAGAPSGTLYVDGVADGAAVTITGTNPYKFAVTLPTLTVGQRVDMYITATISTITTAGIVASAQADTILASDIVGADSDTLETLSDEIAAVKAKTDLLNTSSITVVSAVEGSTITILRGDTFSVSLTDTGDLTDYVSIDFTAKSDKLQTDDEATIRIRKNASGVGDGLLRLNGAAPTTETGSITIDDEATGDITVTLDETATDDLSTGSYSYDIQLITATTVKTLTYGKLTVISDVTRAVV
jgi:predicted RNA-binding protein with TRAM domain